MTFNYDNLKIIIIYPSLHAIIVGINLFTPKYRGTFKVVFMTLYTYNFKDVQLKWFKGHLIGKLLYEMWVCTRILLSAPTVFSFKSIITK